MVAVGRRVDAHEAATWWQWAAAGTHTRLRRGSNGLQRGRSGRLRRASGGSGLPRGRTQSCGVVAMGGHVDAHMEKKVAGDARNGPVRGGLGGQEHAAQALMSEQSVAAARVPLM